MFSIMLYGTLSESSHHGFELSNPRANENLLIQVGSFSRLELSDKGLN